MNEKKQCDELLKYHVNGVNLNFLLIRRKNVFIYRFLLIVFSVYMVSLQTPSSWLFVLAIGIFLGGSFQDISWLSQIAKSWSLTDKITNWKQVEEIAQKDH